MKTYISLNSETQKFHQSTSSQGSNHTSLKQRLKKICLQWIDSLTRSPEVRVWQTHDRDGLTYWHAYNPATGQQATRLSESEMIDWIEQSYHSSVQHNSFRAISRY